MQRLRHLAAVGRAVLTAVMLLVAGTPQLACGCSGTRLGARAAAAPTAPSGCCCGVEGGACCRQADEHACCATAEEEPAGPAEGPVVRGARCVRTSVATVAFVTRTVEPPQVSATLVAPALPGANLVEAPHGAPLRGVVHRPAPPGRLLVTLQRLLI